MRRKIDLTPKRATLELPETVRRVAVEARRVLVINPHEYPLDEIPEGAIVWFEPDPEWSVEEVERYRAELLRAGALRAKALPRQATAEALPRKPVERAVVVGGARAIAMALVEEVREDLRNAVRARVDVALSVAGL